MRVSLLGMGCLKIRNVLLELLFLASGGQDSRDEHSENNRECEENNSKKTMKMTVKELMYPPFTWV